MFAVRARQNGVIFMKGLKIDPIVNRICRTFKEAEWLEKTIDNEKLILVVMGEYLISRRSAIEKIQQAKIRLSSINTQFL